jgi:hypothetical protein
VTRVACYPGSFNPLTLAHLAIAEAALERCGVARVDLVVSRVALEKEHVALPHFEHRIAVLEAAAQVPGRRLGVVVTDAQLLVDVAAGYDVLVLGADKWAQVLDPRFYGGLESARDAAVAALPALALAPRPGAPAAPVPAGTTILDVAPHLAEASSTAVRGGSRHWMAPEAEAFDAETGAWSEPERYERWLRTLDPWN